MLVSPLSPLRALECGAGGTPHGLLAAVCRFLTASGTAKPGGLKGAGDRGSITASVAEEEGYLARARLRRGVGKP